MIVKVTSAAGKVPDPEEGLVKRIQEIPKGSDMGRVFLEIKEYTNEMNNRRPKVSLSLDDVNKYRLTV